MIKAIIFDCFGVLTQDAWRAFCATLPPGEVLEKAHELNHQYDAGVINVEQFLASIKEVTGKSIDLIEDKVNNVEPYKNTELLDLIKQLKPKYKIGLISNVGTNWIRDYFLTEEERALFDDMVLSFEAGTTKPDPKIYQMALERLGVEPAEAVFIDDIDRYCQAAEQVGMKSVEYLNFKQFKKELEKLLRD